MPVILGVAAIVLVAIVLLTRGRNGGKANIDHTPQSPYEREITTQEFQDMVVDHSHQTPVLVDFYANWCRPCHAFSPVLSEMARVCGGSFLLARIDFDTNKELATQLGVTALPAIALYRSGERVDGFSGGRLPHSLRYFLAKNGVAVPDEV